MECCLKAEEGQLMYSGDITSALSGVVKYLYANSSLAALTLVMNNVFSGSSDCGYKKMQCHFLPLYDEPGQHFCGRKMQVGSEADGFGNFTTERRKTMFRIAEFRHSAFLRLKGFQSFRDGN